MNRQRPLAPLADLDIISHEPFNAETPERAIASAITASEHVYVRTNFAVPALDAAHTIVFGGAVAAPFRIDMATLATMPQRTIGVTMECAGNDRLTMRPLPMGEPWRSGAVSTATWSGVPLRALLERAQVAHDAVELVVFAADSGLRDDADGPVRYARAITIGDAMATDAVLALRMNDAPLTPMHGAPVRLVVPGWYGMASVKWVTAIDAVRTPFHGYFQQQRYVFDVDGRIEPVRRMRVKSIITEPRAGASCPRELLLRGWAWSGDGPITRVQIMPGGGTACVDATLGVPDGPHAWTPWECELRATKSGRLTLRSRATDASGATQPDRIEWNRLGYGNNAVRMIMVDVA
jgi:DMSO/TMAO reductase YedYZ molybdopterin-dependent catalytic subunit